MSIATHRAVTGTPQNNSTNFRKGIVMTKKFVLLLATLAFGSSLLSACNTVQGAGKDIERGGEKVQQEAIEHKKY